MKTTKNLCIALCAATFGLTAPASNAQAAEAQSTGDNSSKAAQTENAPKLSYGLDDIVKLSKAKVDETVILAFIKNSTTAYHPSAQDLVQLQELGVSSTVTSALMQHGGELREVAIESQKQAQAEQAAAAAAAATASQPAVDYSQASPQVAPVSTVTYIGYPSYYSYPAYSYYYGGWYAPNYCYRSPRYIGYCGSPRLSFGVQFGGGHFGGVSHGVRGGFHGGVRGGAHGGFRHGR